MTSIQIKLPNGKSAGIGTTPSDHGLPLTRLIEKSGVSLNYRCGKTGRCTGCEVRINESEERVRACTTPYTVDIVTVSIPQKSYMDGHVASVSEFSILANPQPAVLRTGFGIAIDIGTTTIAVAVWNLETGKQLASKTGPNRQAVFGDNLVSRIQHSLDHETGLRDLHETLWDQSILPIIEELLHKSSDEKVPILEGIASGNTVLLHTFTEDSLKGFAGYPFQAEFLRSKNVRKSLSSFPAQIDITTAPSLSAFVGSDITMGAIAAGIPEFEGNCLFIDFGTNGEMLLKANGAYFATATAAGPAFEGGRLCCGSVAKKGALSSIEWKDGAWQITAIDASPENADSICGSAYIDWIALAYKNGLINEMGRFTSDHPNIQQNENNGTISNCFFLNKELFISESDIAELLQAKAAIAAGILTLLELEKIEIQDLQRLIIAGGFGYHINLANAMEIGLIPSVPKSTIHTIGNASLGGASLQLLNPSTINQASSLLEQTQIIELNQQPSFQDHYINCMFIAEL